MVFKLAFSGLRLKNYVTEGHLEEKVGHMQEIGSFA
jgi:hypothetical protein